MADNLHFDGKRFPANNDTDEKMKNPIRMFQLICLKSMMGLSKQEQEKTLKNRSSLPY